jgi:hypothetical protein
MAKTPDKTVDKPAPDYTPEIPEQVKRQIAEAEAIRAQLDPDPAAPVEGAAEAAPEPQPGEGQPPQPEGVAPSGSPPAEDEDTWEQRAKSSQGRLEQVMKTNQALVDRLNEMDKMIATMKVRGIEPETPRPDGAVPITRQKLVTDKEAEDYGEEFLSVVGKRAKEELLPDVESLAERIKKIEGRVEGVGTVMEKNQLQELYSGLTTEIPEWRQINRSNDFKLWLQQPDSYSGRRRHDMLKEAFDRHDSNRVVAFFRGFLTEAVGLPQTPQAQGSSAPPLPNGNGSGKPSLADFAAPGRARSAPQQLPPDKPIYTMAWIAKFSADKLSGKFRGREAEADAVERDIFQAQHEGRIQP